MKQESVRYTYKFMHDLEEEYYENVLALLSKCNHEFVPTLSSRKSTTEKNLAPEEKGRDDVPYEYFEALKKQCFVLVFAETSNNGRMLVGFLSYIEIEKPKVKYKVDDEIREIFIKKADTIYDKNADNNYVRIVKNKWWIFTDERVQLIVKE